MKLYYSSWLLALLALSGCSRAGKPAQTAEAAHKPEPVVVRTALAEMRSVDRSIWVTGSLEPDETVSVSAEVPGRVTAVFVDFGQPVRKGQVIAELDKQELGLQVERAKATLAQALARVGLDPNQEEATPDTSAAIRQVWAQAEDARSKFETAQRLVKTGDISQERFNELEKGYLARKAGLDAARDELRTQLASVRGLRADVQLAEKRLRDATVRAPFDAVVSQRLVASGQYLKENTPIVNLVKTSPLRLRLDVPESATGTIRAGTTLAFTTDAVPGVEFHATVRQLNPALDAKSRSLTAEARLNQNDARLRPGQFVQVRLTTARNSEAVVVPKQALHRVAGLTKVFVIRNGKAVELRLIPGQDLGGFVEVPSNVIQPGDKVAVDQLGQLFDGSEVSARGRV